MEPKSASTPPDDPRDPEARRRAQQLESLGALAGRAAHDFNNVLGVILGYVELARMGLGEREPTSARYLEKALEVVDRARELSDGILDVARVPQAAADVAPPGPALEDAAALLGRTLDARVELEVVNEPGVPTTPLDTAALRQVVMNLCQNAAQAMPEGGRITLGARGVVVDGEGGLPPGSYAVVRVADTGPGVPADLHERIFEPWVTSMPRERNGMGLAVARVLVERFGGRIEAGGGEQGAVFEVWLPNALTSREAHDEGPEGGDVLIIEPDADARAVLRGYLEADGHTVREAATADAGLCELLAGGVRLALIDQRLPDAPGSDVAWRAAALPRAPHLVVLAADPGTVLPAGTRRLAKPFLHADLTQALRGALGNAPG